MRDWFVSIIDWLGSIAESIVQIPIKVGEFIENLGEKILDGLKDIFVPDVDVLKNTIDAMVENISSQLGVQFDTLDRLFDRETAPVDVEENYKLPGVGNVKLKILDTEWLIKGVAFMRPYIRGFIVLLLVLYNWSQILSFIGQDPSIAKHAHENYQENKREKEKQMSFFD